MRKNLLIVIAVYVICCGSGCAWTRQHLSLNPKIDDFGSSIGQAKQVAVKVNDDREESVVGHRSVSGIGAEITLADNTMDTIKSVVFESLKRNGFEPVDFNENAERQLQVDVRLIKFYISMGFATGTVHTKSTFKASAKNKGQSFEQLYRIENEKDIVFVPFEKENEEFINTAVSQALQKMHHDQKLMNFLAQDQGKNP